MAARNVVDYATLTVPTGVVSLADASPALSSGLVSGKTVKGVYFTVETDAVRWRADGTDPSSTEGHQIAVNDSLSFTNYNYSQLISAIKFTRVTGDAKLKITYFD